METLATLLIWVVLVFVAVYTLARMTGQNAEYLDQQTRWDKLVTIADFVVKRGAAYESDEAVYPNWIDDTKLDALNLEEWKKRMELDTLQVGYAPTDGVCLYRLVARGPQKEIAQLWVCAR